MSEHKALEKIVKIRNDDHILSGRRLKVLAEIEIGGELQYNLYDLDEWEPLDWYLADAFEIIQDSVEIGFAISSYELEVLEDSTIYLIDHMVHYQDESRFIDDKPIEIPKVIKPYSVEEISHNIRLVKTFENEYYFILIRNPEENNSHNEVYLGHTPLEHTIRDLSDVDFFDFAELVGVNRYFGENQIFFFNHGHIQPEYYSMLGKNVYVVKPQNKNICLILKTIWL